MDFSKSKGEKRNLRSACASAQADLNFRFSRMMPSTFPHGAARLAIHKILSNDTVSSYAQVSEPVMIILAINSVLIHLKLYV